jgi:hypothetical protein
MLQAFLFPHTQGEVVLHPPSPAGVFTYSTRGKCPFPPLLWSFPPTVTFTSFPAPGCWVGATTPAFSGHLIYLQFHEGLPLPPSLALRVLCLFATCLFCCYYLLFSFFFLFSLGGGQSIHWAMLISSKVVCRSTAWCLAHLVVCIFPSCLGAAVWWRHRNPPGFSI